MPTQNIENIITLYVDKKFLDNHESDLNAEHQKTLQLAKIGKRRNVAGDEFLVQIKSPSFDWLMEKSYFDDIKAIWYPGDYESIMAFLESPDWKFPKPVHIGGL